MTKLLFAFAVLALGQFASADQVFVNRCVQGTGRAFTRDVDCHRTYESQINVNAATFCSSQGLILGNVILEPCGGNLKNTPPQHDNDWTIDRIECCGQIRPN